MSLFNSILEASEHRPPGMLQTPLLPSHGLSDLLGCEVLLKAEHLQTTGSFKYRGAANAIRLLDAEGRRGGVVPWRAPQPTPLGASHVCSSRMDAT